MLSEDDFRGIFGEYFNAVQECIEKGFNRWFLLPPDFRAVASARTRANFIHDFIKDEAQKRFFHVPNIELLEVRGLFLVKFGEDVLLRFKKFDRHFRPQNISTAQTRLFSRQGVQESLFGVPFATKVIAGYRTDKAHAEIQWSGITCPEGKQLHWYINFDKPSTPVLPFQTYQESTEGSGLVATPRPKEDMKDEKRGDENHDV